MSETLAQYAVFGDPISHSKSPKIHGLFAKQTDQVMHYVAHQVSADAFNDTARNFFNQGGAGLNCTVPLKELAFNFADQLSERAKLSKAVNTLKIQADGSIFGDNTDGVGLLRDLMQNHGFRVIGQRLLLLGAGGASRGILGPLLEQSPKCLVIANRSIAKAHTLVAEFAQPVLSACAFSELAGQEFDLILNATSASLNGELPELPDDLLAERGTCYDLAYGNGDTAFVSWGKRQQAQNSLDGLGMLVEQAAEAFFIWRGIRPDTQPVIQLLNAERGR